MDPDNRVPESDESNNIRSPADPVHVVSSREIKILVQPIYNSQRPSLYPFNFSPPQITILSPMNGSTVKRGDEFFWSATDNVSGVARYEVRLNAGPWVDVGLETRWELPENITGPGTFEVRAYDSAGNIAARSVEFEIAEPISGISWEILLWIAVAISAVAIGIGGYLWKKNKK
jgi:hypothetical protein